MTGKMTLMEAAKALEELRMDDDDEHLKKLHQDIIQDMLEKKDE